jgi:hypothetical protein
MKIGGVAFRAALLALPCVVHAFAQTPGGRTIAIASADIDIQRNQPGEIWLSSRGARPAEVRWRVFSGTETLCGLDDRGSLRKDCNDASKLPSVVVPPGASVPVQLYIPDWWREPLHWSRRGWTAWLPAIEGVDSRKVRLELLFGRDAQPVPLDSDLTLEIHSNLLDARTAWIPEPLGNLLYILLWITIGASLLMVAQVMIPNFRRSLQVEGRIEDFRERLRAINSGVGSLLYTRCQQEIKRVAEGLGIQTREDKYFARVRIKGHLITLPRLGSFFSVSINRLALSGNTSEVERLEGMLPKLDSRLTLTERFSDALTAFLSSDTLASAPTSVFEREEKLQNLREILSRQLLTGVEEDTAGAILKDIEQGCPTTEDFARELSRRLEALRRQLSTPVFQPKRTKYTNRINGCEEVFAEKPGTAPPGGWTTDELIYRDLMAVRLRIIVLAIEIEQLLAGFPDLDTSIQERLQSSDPIVLARIYRALKQISEGISEAEIRKALADELWDTLLGSRSVNIRSQDVLQFSFMFREKALNRATARDAFQCFWKITPENNEESAIWEEGWTMQHIPTGRRFSVEPDIYDSVGNQVAIKIEGSPKGRAQIRVTRSSDVSKRALRAVIDAVITALVPVITVAVTQAQDAKPLSIRYLIFLGFTSQAIRAAILPESVRPQDAPKASASDGQTTAKPSPAAPQATVVPPPVAPDPKMKDATKENPAADASSGKTP